MIRPISDWKVENNYIYPKDTSMDRWAFEFLRRNHNYQKDVQDYLAVCNSIIDGFNPFLRPAVDSKQIGNYYDQLDEMARHYEPPLKEGETESQWLTRLASEGLSGKSTPLDVWLAEKWGLNNLFNPYSEFNYLHLTFINTASKVTIAERGWFDRQGIKLVSTADKQAFVINYNLPILQQLAAIKRYASSHKKWLMKKHDLIPLPSKRNRSNLFSIYLRCLDAADAGISESHMAKIFYPKITNEYPDYFGTKKVTDQLKAAKKLRNHDYIYLPLIK